MSFVNNIPVSEKSSVQVAVRVRPATTRETQIKKITNVSGQNVTLWDPRSEEKKNFTYDYVYDQHAQQDDIFNDIGRCVIKNAFRGYNSCVFTYGLTGSGKTYTMLGNERDNPGLIPRVCEGLFTSQKDHGGIDQLNCTITYRIEISYMEIYSEQVKDLLNPDDDKVSLAVREHPEFGPYVEGLKQILVTDYESITRIMARGNKIRHVAQTNMNDRSSRSHAILTIYFTQIVDEPDIPRPREIVSKINLVDLAGSERVEQSKVTGINLKEAVMINKSLSTLGLVINKLVSSDAGGKKYKGKKIHIPFRDSKLTWILKESLGGNSKTYMIATLSPASDHYNETLSTLRYASNAKKIVNNVKINEDPNDKIIRVLRSEIAHLRDELSTRQSSEPQSEETLRVQLDLAAHEALIREKEKSWSDKLKESNELTSRWQTQAQQSEKEKQELQTRSEKAESDNDRLRQEISRMHELTQSLPPTHRQSVTEAMHKLEDQVGKQLSEMREHFTQILHQQTDAAPNQQLESLKTEYKRLYREYEGVKDSRAALHREHTDLRVAYAKLLADKEKLTLLLDREKHDREILSQRYETLEKTMIAPSDSSNNIDMLKEENTALRAQIEQNKTVHQAEIHRRVRQVQQLQSRIAALESRARSGSTAR